MIYVTHRLYVINTLSSFRDKINNVIRETQFTSLMNEELRLFRVYPTDRIFTIHSGSQHGEQRNPLFTGGQPLVRFGTPLHSRTS